MTSQRFAKFRARLVGSSRADDMLTAIADGRILMENRVVADVHEEEIRGEFRQRAHALKKRSFG